jgi:hypothetical protein
MTPKISADLFDLLVDVLEGCYVIKIGPEATIDFRWTMFKRC